MSKFHTNCLLVSLIVLGIPQIVVAQSSNPAIAINKGAPTETSQPLRRKRVVQPIEYWVDANVLNVRDNPVAGNILDTLEYGQRVLAYSQYENWIQLSKDESRSRWVNSDFLSNSPLSWASFNRSRPTAGSDINYVRIKDSENKKKRVFGVRLKKAETGNALITTRAETSQGIYFENRFVSCEGKSVVGVQLVGEGIDFLSAQNDFRNQSYNIYDSEITEEKPEDSTEKAISKFACKSRSF